MNVLGLSGILITLKNKMSQTEKKSHARECLFWGCHLIFIRGVWHTQDPSILSFSFRACPWRYLWCRHLFSPGSLKVYIHDTPLLIPNGLQWDEKVFPTVAAHAASSLLFKLWLTCGPGAFKTFRY